MPATCVVPPLRSRVLTTLAQSEAGLTGRAIARRSDGSVAGVARILDNLVQGGVVGRTDVGSAAVYELNREHLAADAVLLLGNLREALFRRIEVAVTKMEPQPLSVLVFGSALGSGDASSDIDVLMIRPPGVTEDEEEWSDAVADLESAISRWTGNPATIVEYGDLEFRRAVRANRPFVRSLRAGSLHIAGLTLSQLTQRARRS